MHEQTNRRHHHQHRFAECVDGRSEVDQQARPEIQPRENTVRIGADEQRATAQEGNANRRHREKRTEFALLPSHQ